MTLELFCLVGTKLNQPNPGVPINVDNYRKRGYSLDFSAVHSASYAMEFQVGIIFLRLVESYQIHVKMDQSSFHMLSSHNLMLQNVVVMSC